MNQHIETYLKHYIALNEPQFAVLLTGKWGSGKTYFIDKFIENNKEENVKYIKVSLFGLYKTSEIDEQIFQIIHPLLGSKYAKFAGSMLTSAVKFGFNLDIDGDKKSDAKLSFDSKVFEEYKIFFDGKKAKKDLVFIFDDLERTQIPLIQILGYINSLVEVSNQKVIILANESKIENKDKSQYDEFKEKVIGKTFEVNNYLDDVVKHFIESNTDSKEILNEHSVIIKDTFNRGGYKNLRHLKQTIGDFDYLYPHIKKEYQDNQLFIQALIKLFFAFSIEIKKGNFTQKEFGVTRSSIAMHKYIQSTLDGLSDEEFEEMLEKDDSASYKHTNILNKYNLSESDILLRRKTWTDILFNGLIDDERLNIEVSKSTYFHDEQTPSWMKLWDIYKVEDSEFDTLISDVEKNFEDNNYEEYEEFLHVVAILLSLAKKGLYKKDQDEIISQAKENIKSLITSDLWKSTLYRYNGFSEKYNLSYIDESSENVKEILQYVQDKSKEAYYGNLKTKSKELLENLDNRLVFSHELESKYKNIPIFSTMDDDDFIVKLISITNKHRQLTETIHILRDCRKLPSELGFWKGVDKKILSSIDKEERKVTYSIIEDYFKNDVLKTIIQNLEKVCKEESK